MMSMRMAMIKRDYDDRKKTAESMVKIADCLFESSKCCGYANCSHVGKAKRWYYRARAESDINSYDRSTVYVLRNTLSQVVYVQTMVTMQISKVSSRMGITILLQLWYDVFEINCVWKMCVGMNFVVVGITISIS